MKQRQAWRVRQATVVALVLGAMQWAVPTAGGDEVTGPPLSGYVRDVPAETSAHREARHREVARRLQQPALIILHRGAGKLAPENTLEAYAAAMDRGADGCEIDIRRSADGVLYLHHDDDLGRVFEGSGPVSRLTYYSLLGGRLKDTLGAADDTTHIPTLAALLGLAQQRAMLLHLDIKEPGLDDDIAVLLDAADAWDHVVHVNDYNSENLRKDPRLKLLTYKGWFEQAGEGPDAMAKFLARPGKLIIMDNDPTPAVKALGRTAPTAAAAVPVPRGLRAQWLAPAALLHLAVAEDSPDAKPKDPTAKDAHGWRPLFNGKDLDGWNPIGTAKWRVEDGVIVGGQDGDPSRSGLLTTKDQFTDFALELEFMIDEHGKYNSGVYLRNDPDTARRTGYQINIGRGAAEEYCAGLYTDRWLGKGDEKDTIRKKLDWNKLRIVAKGPHIESELNGVKVVDYTDPNPPAKFLQKGVLGLQTYGAEGHSGWVKFRNIRIREID